MSDKNQSITILGAGLVGCLLSIYLAKRGYKVDIYERRSDMRKAKVEAGRSINLALSERGWTALNKVGIKKDIEAVAIPMKGRMIHNLDGTQSFQPYGKEGQAIYSVSRSGLNSTLLDCAESFENISIHFNHKSDEVNLKNKNIVFESSTGKKEIKYDLLFGADGAFSSLRNAMLRTDRFEYKQSYIDHGYKEFCIPAGNNNSWQQEKNALHIWPRKSFMMIALPNLDGSFTCTLFFPFEGEVSFSKIQNENDVENFFTQYFPDLISLIPTYKKDFFANPTSSLVTVKCFPWIYDNNTCLIGDSAHAIVPFFGQGMNCGFEDCRILDELFDKNNSWENILNEFQHSRKPNADAIADLALNNFIEMRDLVAVPHFLKKKSIEKRIAELFPDKFISAYGMVSFSNLPYNEALKKGSAQNDLLERLAAIENLSDEIIKKEAAIIIS